MNELGLFLFLATAFESFAQYAWSIRNWREHVPSYLALAIALAAAATLKLDLFAVLGFTVPYTWVTVFLTGFSLARGANFIHDLVSMVQLKYKSVKLEARKNGVK